MEYFADLFSACYAGEAAIYFLEAFAPGDGTSNTHPATASRVGLMRDFLSGAQNAIVDLFQSALLTRGLPALRQQFRMPDVSQSFANVRPHPVADEAELHGVFLAGWQFLQSNPSSRLPAWDGLSSSTVEAATNDLVEKSIRNYMLREAWNEAAQ